MIVLGTICFLSVMAFTNGYTTVIRVDNGETGGLWQHLQSCPIDSFAVGFDMKIEDYQEFPHDNTALNGIKLICQHKNGTLVGNVTSDVLPLGKWVGETYCEKRNGQNFYLTSFALQVQRTVNESEILELPLSVLVNGSDDSYDNTAVNFIKFKCGDFARTHPSYDLIKAPGRGRMGQYGNWSECPLGTAICGIRTRTDDYSYRNFEDDTAVNDVEIWCCEKDFNF